MLPFKGWQAWKPERSKVAPAACSQDHSVGRLSMYCLQMQAQTEGVYVHISGLSTSRLILFHLWQLRMQSWSVFVSVYVQTEVSVYYVCRCKDPFVICPQTLCLVPGLGTLPFPALGAGLGTPNHLFYCVTAFGLTLHHCCAYMHLLQLLAPRTLRPCWAATSSASLHAHMMENPFLRKTIRNGIWCIRRGQRALIRQGARPDKYTEWLLIYMQPVLPFYSLIHVLLTPP